MSVKESTEGKSFFCMKISGYFFSLLKLPQKVRYCSSFSNCFAVCCEPKREIRIRHESCKAVGLWGTVGTWVTTWRCYTEKPSSKLSRRYPGDGSGGMNAAHSSAYSIKRLYWQCCSVTWWWVSNSLGKYVSFFLHYSKLLEFFLKKNNK